MDDQWKNLKSSGASHYKTGSVEPIDLYRSAIPHPHYNAFDVKALTDIIKYAFRLLTRGYLHSDVEKIRHYLNLYEADRSQDNTIPPACSSKGDI
jgi:hypothetical protein